MSTRTGTLQPPRAGQAFWMPALLTLVVAAAFTVAAIAIGADEGRDDARIGAVQGSRFANTPTEIRGGIAPTTAGGTLANTPTEIRGGVAPTTAGGTLANTPTELSGGMSFGGVHKPIDVNGRLCGQCG